MKVYLVLSKQTIPDGEFNAYPFGTYEEAVKCMEEISGKEKSEWDDENFVVFEDCYECVARIIEDEIVFDSDFPYGCDKHGNQAHIKKVDYKKKGV